MGLNPGQAPAHLPSLDDKIKGGQQVTPLKILANSFRNRKWCGPKCEFSDVCPMLPLSLSKEQEIVTESGVKHPCKLKEAPAGVQRRIQNMFLNGEEGLLNEIRNALFVAGTNLGADVKERLAYADALGRLHKTIYGEKATMSSMEPLEITVRHFAKPDGLSGQEVKVIRQETAQKFLDKKKPIEVTQEEAPDLFDSESLMTSPIIDTIAHVIRPKEDDQII